ncbi:hypothetical protein DFS34DRAFT_692631 [Phlyctochytrium arcticum]|nr:hypothetical protein DFS34DRAFT_692631 [Phlyctochytrium arcticum]
MSTTHFRPTLGILQDLKAPGKHCELKREAFSEMGPMGDPMFTPVQEPLTWDEIRDVLDTWTLERFSRTQQVLDDYIKWRENVANSFVRPADELLIEVHGYHSAVDPATGKLCAVPPSDASNLRRIVLRENHFPYATKPHGEISHYVLWSLEEMSEEQVAEYLHEQKPGFEFLYYVNPPNRKTIPDIFHFQVFMRKRKI